MTAEHAISRFRRDVTLGTLLRGALFAAGVAAIGLSATPLRGRGIDGTSVLMAIAFLWVFLSYRSVRGSRLAAESPSLIAAGQFEQAEKQIELALRSFSLFRATKVLSLHHLALLRHAQGQWRDAAILSQAVLGQRLARLGGVSKPTRLLLADSLLELNDLQGAYVALGSLSVEKLSLIETVSLLLIQLEYEARIGAWAAMLPRGGIYQRVQLAELMPSANSAKAQALMALAAKRTGLDDWAEWLRRRAELLADPAELMKAQPLLASLWEQAGQGNAM